MFIYKNTYTKILNKHRVNNIANTKYRPFLYGTQTSVFNALTCDLLHAR